MGKIDIQHSLISGKFEKSVEEIRSEQTMQSRNDKKVLRQIPLYRHGTRIFINFFLFPVDFFFQYIGYINILVS